MKILGKALLGAVAVLVAILVVLRITGLNPRGPRPGLWLSGKVISTLVPDWSFANRYSTIEVQTSTPYFLPHSVTIWCVSYDGHLYLQALGRTWSGDVVRDPHVRVKVGEQLYDGTAFYVKNPTEFFGVAGKMTQKYSPRWPPLKKFDPHLFFRFEQQ